MIEVHLTAIVGQRVELGDGVHVGPYTIIEDDVSIGTGTWIDAHVKVCQHTRLGSDCRVHFGAVLGHTSTDLKYHGGECLTMIGDRNVLREYVTISSSSFEGKATVVGHDNLLMHWSNVAHDCVVGDRVIMANFATLGGHVEIEGNCRIGAHAAFHQYVRVGRGSMAGACSKFTQDVAPYMIADGHPASLRGVNSLGRGTAQNHPLADVSDESVALLKKAFHILFRSETPLHESIARVRADIPPDPHVAHLLDFVESSKRGVCR